MVPDTLQEETQAMDKLLLFVAWLQENRKFIIYYLIYFILTFFYFKFYFIHLFFIIYYLILYEQGLALPLFTPPHFPQML